MRIGFVTPWRVADETAWSGMVKPMFEALRQGADVIPIETGDEPDSLVDRVACRVLDRRAGRYLVGQGLATAHKRAAALRRRLASTRVDVVLAVAASQDIALLGGELPVLSVTDASFEALQCSYPSYQSVNALSAWQAKRLDRLAANRTSCFVVPSEWAADALQQDLAVSTSQVAVVPFGPAIAPLDWQPRVPPAGSLRLLLVSSDWERKGGATGLRAVQAARAAGLAVELTAVGDTPVLPGWVACSGRCSRSELAQLYATHHAVLEPTLANAGAVTVTDAASFGLPVIASAIGGIRDVVRDGVTGFLIQDWDSAQPVAAMAELLTPERWAELSVAARAGFESNLNWDHWADGLMPALSRATR